MERGQANTHTLLREGMRMTTVVHQIGNTKVTVHSQSGIIGMSPEEQQAWFLQELEANSVIVKGIVEAVSEIHMHLQTNEVKTKE
jgi:hypothetical protein